MRLAGSRAENIAEVLENGSNSRKIPPCAAAMHRKVLLDEKWDLKSGRLDSDGKWRPLAAALKSIIWRTRWSTHTIEEDKIHTGDFRNYKWRYVRRVLCNLNL